MKKFWNSLTIFWRYYAKYFEKMFEFDSSARRTPVCTYCWRWFLLTFCRPRISTFSFSSEGTSKMQTGKSHKYSNSDYKRWLSDSERLVGGGQYANKLSAPYITAMKIDQCIMELTREQAEVFSSLLNY